MDEQGQVGTPENCPGSGSQGEITYQQGGDDWYVKCPTCGTTWADVAISSSLTLRPKTA